MKDQGQDDINDDKDNIHDNNNNKNDNKDNINDDNNGRGWEGDKKALLIKFLFVVRKTKKAYN